MLPPTCREEISELQTEASLAPTRWFAKVIVTKGGAAGKGPDAPEPPQMTTDGSSEYPPMLEELDAAEVEGKTKMAFAKMQIPANVRELHLLTDADFATSMDNTEEATATTETSDADAGNHADGLDGDQQDHDQTSVRDDGLQRESSVADSLESSGARSRGSAQQLVGEDGNSSHSGSLRGDSLSRRASRRHTTSSPSNSPSPDKKRSQQRSRGSVRQQADPASQAAKMGLYA